MVARAAPAALRWGLGGVVAVRSSRALRGLRSRSACLLALISLAYRCATRQQPLPPAPLHPARAGLSRRLGASLGARGKCGGSRVHTRGVAALCAATPLGNPSCGAMPSCFPAFYAVYSRYCT